MTSTIDPGYSLTSLGSRPGSAAGGCGRGGGWPSTAPKPSWCSAPWCCRSWPSPSARTNSMEKVDGLQSVPVGALAYDPAPDWKHGVVVFPSGEIDLIDADSGRKIAQIDPGNELQSVAYSPDGSRVAIATANYDSENDLPDHLRIWETATGRMLHELRPLEGTPRDGFGAPFWWSDGKYLFVLTREGSYGGAIIGIWNTESGRYRGGLTGCSVPGTEYPLILEDGKFHIDCDHEVLMWEAKGALERIADFEGH